MPPLASSSKPRRWSPCAKRGDPALVVDGEERPPHAAIISRTTSGSIRCSTVWIRACRRLGGVAGENRDRLLAEHPAGVDAFVDEVHGRARLRGTGGERVLDRVGARERGEQGGVHVHDPIREARQERRPQEVHVAGAHHELDAARGEPLGHGPVTRIAVRIVVEREDAGRGAGSRGAREGRRAGDVRRHRRDRYAGIDQGLEIRAAAADEDADACASDVSGVTPM